jgi:hypothetical protein
MDNGSELLEQRFQAVGLMQEHELLLEKGVGKNGPGGFAGSEDCSAQSKKRMVFILGN